MFLPYIDMNPERKTPIQYSSILNVRNTFPIPCPDFAFMRSMGLLTDFPWQMGSFFCFKPGFGKQCLEFPSASQIFLRTHIYARFTFDSGFNQFESWVLTSNCALSHIRPTGLLCPWNFPGKIIGVELHFWCQGIFLTQGSSPRLLCVLGWEADSFLSELWGKSSN